MSFLNFEIGPVQDAISKVMSQKQEMDDLESKTFGYIPKVEGAWRGGDEKEFGDDLQRKLLPAIRAVSEAISGFGGNLGAVGNIMGKADSKVGSMVGGLSDMFGSFLKK